MLLVLTPKGRRVLEELALHHHEELQEAAPTSGGGVATSDGGKRGWTRKGTRRTTKG